MIIDVNCTAASSNYSTGKGLKQRKKNTLSIFSPPPQMAFVFESDVSRLKSHPLLIRIGCYTVTHAFPPVVLSCFKEGKYRRERG